MGVLSKGGGQDVLCIKYIGSLGRANDSSKSLTSCCATLTRRIVTLPSCRKRRYIRPINSSELRMIASPVRHMQRSSSDHTTRVPEWLKDFPTRFQNGGMGLGIGAGTSVCSPHLRLLSSPTHV